MAYPPLQHPMSLVMEDRRDLLKMEVSSYVPCSGFVIVHSGPHKQHYVLVLSSGINLCSWQTRLTKGNKSNFIFFWLLKCVLYFSYKIFWSLYVQCISWYYIILTDSQYTPFISVSKYIRCVCFCVLVFFFLP